MQARRLSSPRGTAKLPSLALALVAAAGCGGTAGPEPDRPSADAFSKRLAEARSGEERRKIIEEQMLFPDGKPAPVARGRGKAHAAR